MFFRSLALAMNNRIGNLVSVAALLVFACPVLPVSAQTAEAEDSLITIESDTQSADNITGVVTALGNVRIVYPSRGMVATSRQAQYFSREALLVLSGDVDVVQEDEIVFALNGLPTTSTMNVLWRNQCQVSKCSPPSF